MISLKYDAQAEVLDIWIPDVKVVHAQPSANDNNLILEYDDSGAIVGIQILSPGDLTHWENHPDRTLIPDLILEQLDLWRKAKLN